MGQAGSAGPPGLRLGTDGSCLPGRHNLTLSFDRERPDPSELGRVADTGEERIAIHGRVGKVVLLDRSLEKPQGRLPSSGKGQSGSGRILPFGVAFAEGTSLQLTRYGFDLSFWTTSEKSLDHAIRSLRIRV